jgi:uncharacterized membrane protein
MTNPYSESDIERFRHIHLAANLEANEFARTGLANLLLLNGGAIIALAPLGAMFEVVVKSHRIEVIFILLSFVVGLVAGILGYLIGFFVNSELSHMGQQIIIGESQASVEQTRKRHNIKRYIGIVCAMLSILAFLVGCGIGALILLWP